MLERVISGGQSGVDQASLSAAKAMGIATGGWAPKGFRTTYGSDPSLARYGLVEHVSWKYAPRTYANVRDADGTLIMSLNWASPGTRLTMRAARQARKPMLKVDLNEDIDYRCISEWIVAQGITILNVAGNSETSAPGVYGRVETVLMLAFKELGFDLL